MSTDLTSPIFKDEVAAWKHFEAIRWPDGPECPHCGLVNEADPVIGKTARPGLYRCHACVKQFTATIGTVYERSHIPMHKWLLATHLLCAGKKGISAHQLWRTLGVGSYRTAWFMARRIREGMSDTGHKATGGLCGTDKVVEVDETCVGGKAKNRAYRKLAPKKAVVTPVERDGRAKSCHVANVTEKTVRPIIVTNANRASALMSDESPIYPEVGDEFANHHTVNHFANGYVRLGGYVHPNTAENFYSILKRGITGVYHPVSEAHLHRYLAEFDFRYSNRSGFGVEATERAAKALKGVAGKQLTYRLPRHAANA